jgi:hypothetical protein
MDVEPPGEDDVAELRELIAKLAEALITVSEVLEQIDARLAEWESG